MTSIQQKTSIQVTTKPKTTTTTTSTTWILIKWKADKTSQRSYYWFQQSSSSQPALFSFFVSTSPTRISVIQMLKHRLGTGLDIMYVTSYGIQIMELISFFIAGSVNLFELIWSESCRNVVSEESLQWILPLLTQPQAKTIISPCRITNYEIN